MSFKECEILRIGTKNILEHVMSMELGETLLYEDIESLSGVGRHSEKWNTLVKKFRSAAQRSERGIVMRCVPNVGYRLLTREEQITIPPIDRSRRARRQLFRGSVEVDRAPSSELTGRQMLRKARYKQGMRAAGRMALAQAREAAALRKQEGLPRPKMPANFHL